MLMDNLAKPCSAPPRKRCASTGSIRQCKDDYLSVCRRIAPGPADYNPDDRLHAHHANFPAATFGRGPGHDALHKRATTPGPADFNLNNRETWHGHAFRATMGRAPGHCFISTKCSPGPGDYDIDDTLLAGHLRPPVPTMGHAPGHSNSIALDSTPSPGFYYLCSPSCSSHHRKSSAVSLDCAGREHYSAEERALFRKADKNCDGFLDMNEIRCLLKARFPSMSNAALEEIMHDADRNQDVKLTFEELMEYTHSTNPAGRRLRDKFLMAFAAPGDHKSYREGEERMQFRRADLNYDGHLDEDEVGSLMRKCFPDIKKRDVRSIFQAMDRDRDGKVDFNEVAEYTRSKDPSESRLREKFIEALSMPCKEVASCKTKLSNGPKRHARSASAVGALIAGQTNSA